MIYVIFGMGKQSMDALLVDFITNFDIDMMDTTVAYCIVLYCNHEMNVLRPVVL